MASERRTNDATDGKEPLLGLEFSRPSAGGASTTRPPTQADLAQLVADAVGRVPGVVRLEPTLQNLMLMRVGQTAVPSRRGLAAAKQGLARFGDAVVGVRVSVRELVADVRVDIAVDTSRCAADTALAVEQAVVDTLHARDQLAGAIAVTVLAIEPAPTLS